MPTPESHRSVAALALSRSWHSHGTWTLYSVVKVPEGIPPHLFPVGEAVFGGVFQKIHNFFTYSPVKDLFEWVWKVPSIDRQRERAKSAAFTKKLFPPSCGRSRESDFYKAIRKFSEMSLQGVDHENTRKLRHFRFFFEFRKFFNFGRSPHLPFVNFFRFGHPSFGNFFSQRVGSEKIVFLPPVSNISSLVPTGRGQKLCLLWKFPPQYPLLTFLTEMGKIFSSLNR